MDRRLTKGAVNIVDMARFARKTHTLSQNQSVTQVTL